MSDDLTAGASDLIVLHDGRVLTTHGPSVCFGEHCCIHNPSQHPLNTAPLSWVRDLRLMFRVCEHDSIHPDPDAMDYRTLLAVAGLLTPYDGWHPCCPDRCCVPERNSDDHDH